MKTQPSARCWATPTCPNLWATLMKKPPTSLTNDRMRTNASQQVNGRYQEIGNGRLPNHYSFVSSCSSIGIPFLWEEDERACLTGEPVIT